MSESTETTRLINDSEYGSDELPSVANPSPPPADDSISTTQLVLIAASVYLGTILAAIDTTVVTTLMSHIASDLKQLENISWVATGYTVAYSAFQPLYGKFSDIIGRKRVLLFCTSVFGVGCLMCGMAHSLTLLVAGRFVSGIGAGGMLSIGTITMSDYTPLRLRGIMQGLGNVCFGSGAALGGVFGSSLTARGGWRLAFTAQVPLALVSAVMAGLCIRDKQIPSSQVMRGEHADHPVKRNSLERIDVVGSITLVSSLLLLMLAVTTGGHRFPWFSWPIAALLISSGLSLYVFWWWEVNKAVEPVMPTHLLTHRTIVSACLTNFFGSGYCYAYLYYGPIFLQTMYHYSYIEISHRIMVNFLGVATGSLGAGLYMRSTGKYWGLGVSTGLFMILASTLFILVPYLPHWVGSSPVYQSAAYLFSGIGYAAMLTVTLVALIAAVPSEFQATTTSAQYTFRGAGSSIGIAVAAAIFQNVLLSQLKANVHGKHAGKIIRTVAESVEAVWDVPKEYLPGVLLSYERAGVSVFYLCLTLAFLSLTCSAYQREHSLERR